MGTHTTDSLCELVKRWVDEREGKYDFRFWRISLDGKRPRRNLQDIEDANVLVIISYMEFLYHIKGRQGGWEFRRSWNDLLDMRKIINPKKQVIWLFSSDNRDDVDLYQNYVFPNIPIKIVMFDENLKSPTWERNGYNRFEWFGNIHSQKKSWINTEYQKVIDRNNGIPPYRDLDFVFWGSTKRLTISDTKYREEIYRGYGKEKYDYRKFDLYEGIESGDKRHQYLKSIKGNKDINSFYIGVFKGDGFTADLKGWFPMKELLPILFRSKMSICFNWYDDGTNITSRLYECMSAGIVPLLVGNYDIKNFGRRWETAQEEIGIELVKQLEQYIRVENETEAISRILDYKNIYQIGYEKDYGNSPTATN
jgi:hypothetical protein